LLPIGYGRNGTERPSRGHPALAVVFVAHRVISTTPLVCQLPAGVVIEARRGRGMLAAESFGVSPPSRRWVAGGFQPTGTGAFQAHAHAFVSRKRSGAGCSSALPAGSRGDALAGMPVSQWGPGSSGQGAGGRLAGGRLHRQQRPAPGFVRFAGDFAERRR
jgi:hypothetical protein